MVGHIGTLQKQNFVVDPMVVVSDSLLLWFSSYIPKTTAYQVALEKERGEFLAKILLWPLHWIVGGVFLGFYIESVVSSLASTLSQWCLPWLLH